MQMNLLLLRLPSVFDLHINLLLKGFFSNITERRCRPTMCVAARIMKPFFKTFRFYKHVENIIMIN